MDSQDERINEKEKQCRDHLDHLVKLLDSPLDYSE
jgi:hypothetical protein